MDKELDKIFYKELRSKTVTLEQERILKLAKKRLKPAILNLYKECFDVLEIECRLQERYLVTYDIFHSNKFDGMKTFNQINNKRMSELQNIRNNMLDNEK